MRSRRYVVNATVILGSLPLFTKRNVGGALLMIEENGAEDCGSFGLQFGAGSWPQHLRGLNRFGATQEIVRTEHGNVAEAVYMSFMTSSREANLAQAEKAFRSAADSLPITVASGRCTAAGCSANLRHEEIASKLSWTDTPQLLDELRSHVPFESARLIRGSKGAVLPTFLYSVRRALMQNTKNTAALYAHNGETYRLVTEARQDAGTGAVVVTGRTTREGGHGESEFRVWIGRGRGADLPLKIDFRAKSYLRLTLEPDDSQNRPLFKTLLDKPDAFTEPPARSDCLLNPS